MKKISSKHQLNNTKVTNLLYNLDEGIELLKVTATAKFLETVELHVNLTRALKGLTSQLRSTVTLPHGSGQKLTIAALVPDDLVEDAYANGASIAGNAQLILDIQKGIINFDVLITVPEMMPKLAKFGRILGPKGLMPSPKSGTVTNNLFETLIEFRKGKFEYKADKTNIIHIPAGKSNFTNLQLKENITALYQSIKQNRPINLKGKYINTIFICNTMGPSIQIDLSSFE